MTDDDEAVVPLGRRLDALARARVHALAPWLAWVAPLAVALRHLEAVADVLGERFERTDTPPWARAQRVGLLAAPGGVPRTQAGGQPAGRAARDGSGPMTVASPAEPSLAEAEGDSEVPDEDVRQVPADVRSRLRREVGPAADLMRVHDGPQADAHARAADADALTLGSDVYVRQGRWAPRRDEGVALLAHEATHIASLIDPGEAWRRAVGDEAEEALAQAHERSLLGAAGPVPAPVTGAQERSLLGAAGPFSTAPMTGGLPDILGTLAAPFRTAPARGAPTSPAAMSNSAHPPPPGATVAASARRAGVERDRTTSPAPAPDLDALRRSVIAEVMQRLRSEIERGA